MEWCNASRSATANSFRLIDSQRHTVCEGCMRITQTLTALAVAPASARYDQHLDNFRDSRLLCVLPGCYICTKRPCSSLPRMQSAHGRRTDGTPAVYRSKRESQVLCCVRVCMCMHDTPKYAILTVSASFEQVLRAVSSIAA